MHAFITSFCLCIVNFFFPRKAYTRSCNISTTLNLFYYCFSLVQVQTVVLLVSSFSHLICCLIISFGFQEVPYLLYSNIKIICSCSVSSIFFYFIAFYTTYSPISFLRLVTLLLNVIYWGICSHILTVVDRVGSCCPTKTG